MDSRRFRLNITTLTGIVFLIPSLLFITFSTFIPAVWNLFLSFQQWDGFLKRKWVYFDNYITAFHDKDFLHALKNSIYLAVVTTIIAVFFGLIVAIFVSKVNRFEGAFFRLIFFMPIMLPLVISGLLFTFVYNPEMGLINSFLRLMGAGSLTNAWLENPHTIMNAICIVSAWHIFGLTMILCFAAIQSIPSSLYEASKLDGASNLNQVFLITLPMIKPIIQLSTIYTLVSSFKSYDLVYVMTKGGPGSFSNIVPLQMITTAFQFDEFGYSAAMGILLTFVVLFIFFVTRKIIGGEHYEY